MFSKGGGNHNLYVYEQSKFSRGRLQFNNQTNECIVYNDGKHRRCFEKVKQRSLIEIGSRLEKASLKTSLQLKSNSAIELAKLRVEQSIIHVEDIARAKALSTNGF